jgi:hypothetical protein
LKRGKRTSKSSESENDSSVNQPSNKETSTSQSSVDSTSTSLPPKSRRTWKRIASETSDSENDCIIESATSDICTTIEKDQLLPDGQPCETGSTKIAIDVDSAADVKSGDIHSTLSNADTDSSPVIAKKKAL